MTPHQDSNSKKVVKFVRRVNNVDVEQRTSDGFINGTAMCVAHGKDISEWLILESVLRLVAALARKLGVEPIPGKLGNSVYKRVSGTYPSLIVVKRGSPENGGGTWIHPKLGIHLGQWCNEDFALQVSDWIEEWMTTGRNPIEVDVDRELMLWQQRYDIRVYLKDFLRPELMHSVVHWAIENGKSPITLCSTVHDLMNERIQGAKSKQIQLLGGLPLGVLIRDYFGASPLVTYSAINKLAKNAIDDRGLDPAQAVHEACDHFLGKAYKPELVELEENLYIKGSKLIQTRKQKRISQGLQLELPLWHEGQAG
jgi:hypothetical protein